MTDTIIRFFFFVNMVDYTDSFTCGFQDLWGMIEGISLVSKSLTIMCPVRI